MTDTERIEELVKNMHKLYDNQDDLLNMIDRTFKCIKMQQQLIVSLQDRITKLEERCNNGN